VTRPSQLHHQGLCSLERDVVQGQAGPRRRDREVAATHTNSMGKPATTCV
jgi:hypothetical protein